MTFTVIDTYELRLTDVLNVLKDPPIEDWGRGGVGQKSIPVGFRGACCS